MSKIYTFNRRVVDDQQIYVRADSLAEAWKKARNEDVEQTDDAKIVKVTLRHLSEQQP